MPFEDQESDCLTESPGDRNYPNFLRSSSTIASLKRENDFTRLPIEPKATSILVTISHSRQLIVRLDAQFLFQVIILVFQLPNFTFQTIDHVLFGIRLDNGGILDVLRSTGITQRAQTFTFANRRRRDAGDLELNRSSSFICSFDRTIRVMPCPPKLSASKRVNLDSR